MAVEGSNRVFKDTVRDIQKVSDLSNCIKERRDGKIKLLQMNEEMEAEGTDHEE